MDRIPTTLFRLALLSLAILGLSLVLLPMTRRSIVTSNTNVPLVAASAENGFTWSMPQRFGAKRADGIVDFHWRASAREYEPTYVNPNGWKVDFDACSPGVVSGNTYAWQINGADVPNPNPASCRFSHEFRVQGTYAVKLVRSATDGTQTTFESQVTVKDLLIVSLGDSFASGQGSPDIEKTKSTSAKWVDPICARSASAGPAKAAIDIENGDPHTSVTFISFACTGAQINDGIIQAQTPTVKSQMDELKRTLQGRPIDALVISIGGNDIGFSRLVARCIFRRCDNHSETLERLTEALNDLPGKYQDLSNSIASLPSVKKVFITEYPDLVRDENGQLCDDGPKDDRVLRRIDASESGWASASVIAGLNRKVKEASDRHGWIYVSGVADAFRTHGFCAAPEKRWVRTFHDAKRVQGADGACDLTIVTSFDRIRACLISSGTFHPGKLGHEHGYAPNLVDALRNQGIIRIVLSKTS